MDEPESVTKLMAHGGTEFQIARVVSHSSVIHSWLVLADVAAVSAKCGPVSISVEGDADV